MSEDDARSHSDPNEDIHLSDIDGHDEFTADTAAAGNASASALPSTEEARGMCTIDKKTAVIIFLARQSTPVTKDDRLATRLSDEHGISPKAVRDIWNMRTWCRATRPYWTPAQEHQFISMRFSANVQKKRRTVQPGRILNASQRLPLQAQWKRANLNSCGLLEEALCWLEGNL